mgnify:CR=1 FL=1
MCTSSLAGGSQQFLGEECTAGMRVPSCTLFLGWILHAAGDPSQMQPHEMCVTHRKCETTVCCVAIEMCRCGVALAAAAGVAVAVAMATAVAVAAAVAAPAAPAADAAAAAMSAAVAAAMTDAVAVGSWQL